MNQLREHLEREVASLYGFVESISRACVPAPQSVAYPESSSRFFEYILHIAESTKKHLEGFERHADDSESDFQRAGDRRREGSVFNLVSAKGYTTPDIERDGQSCRP